MYSKYEKENSINIKDSWYWSSKYYYVDNTVHWQSRDKADTPLSCQGNTIKFQFFKQVTEISFFFKMLSQRINFSEVFFFYFLMTMVVYWQSSIIFFSCYLLIIKIIRLNLLQWYFLTTYYCVASTDFITQIQSALMYIAPTEQFQPHSGLLQFAD